MRQLLADKVSGNLLGLWLLVAEHLRLGTWDLLCAWCRQAPGRVEPRLALQLVHEAALCVTGIRQARCLSSKGFELLNGLPFVASDQAVHDLLEAHTVAEAQALQHHLGLVRRARGHFVGRLLAIDPHRLRSYSQRQMPRYRGDDTSKPFKVAQTFFCLDADSRQPVCFTTGSSAVSATQATPPLLALAEAILGTPPDHCLVVLDTEHYTAQLIDHVAAHTPFDLLVPMPRSRPLAAQMRQVPPDAFTPRWAGLATARMPYRLQRSTAGPYWQLIQRTGETPDTYDFTGFLATADRDELDGLTLEYPKRWHIEEFFNAHQAIGWDRAGTLNLHIRTGQMTLALVAQAALHGLRSCLGDPYATWDAKHLAQALFRGLDGDLRVADDTLVVTFYNPPNAQHLRAHYEQLPQRLAAEGIDPRIPWLYGFKLDFRFR